MLFALDHLLVACVENVNLYDGDIWGLCDCFDVLVLETKQPTTANRPLLIGAQR